ncbi:MAG: serine/threonine protein kinase [Planctomycetes bacterium]|nr:serine/threonine protein kinase [Planctomycetota bacterium]
MSASEGTAPDPQLQRLNDLLAECILALEQEGEHAIEPILARAPDLAERARSRLRGLRSSGLLAEPHRDPERIGPYRVLQRLGAGGMGTVYLAEQKDTLARRVAVKVVKPGMDSREVLARFAVERQAMAMLDHQNIAKALDAGQTEDGRPYLVMEYVSGLPITRYCDERRLGLAARIELFCLVCEAVQHAHHKGLIHRDLKPSNILVADREGRPWPMVIDFGVAKSLGGRLSDQSLVTLRGHLLGTPEYMSPEQAANDLDVDTRTDVFSLGAVLYELLTGTLPIDSSRLRRASSGDLPRLLRDSEAPAPSRRITSAGAAPTGAAERRQTDDRRLRRRLRGDLDWITLRALERDRNRRYGMPGELAADLQRHLRREPVLAGPPSLAYRWSRFMARNRLPVASAAAVLLTLVAGLIVSVRAFRAAAASAMQAEADFASAMAAIDRLVFFGDQRLVAEPQMDDVRRHLLTDALQFYERLAQTRSEEPRLQQRIAVAALRAGRIHYLLGDNAAALRALDAAAERARHLPPGIPPHPALDGIELMRGQVLLAFGRQAEAEAAFRAAAGVYARRAGEADGDPTRDRNHLLALSLLARNVRQHDAQSARSTFDEAMAVAAPWLGGSRGDTREFGVAASIAVQHATLLADLGDLAAARSQVEALYVPLTAEWVRRAEREREDLLAPVHELGSLCGRLGARAEAMQLLEYAAEHQRWVCATHPAKAGGPRLLALVLSALADVQVADNRFGPARTTAAEAAQVADQMLLRFDDASNRNLVGRVHVNRARVQLAPRALGGEVDALAAEASLARGIGLLEALPTELRQQRDTRLSLAGAWSMRADNHRAAGDRAAAKAATERTLDEFTAIAAAHPEQIQVRASLAERRCALATLLLDDQQWERALELAAAAEADAPAIEAATPTIRPGTFARAAARIRLLAHAGRADVDAALAEVRRPSDIERDWSGHRQKAEALVALARNLAAADVRRDEVLAEARTLLHEALAFGLDMEPGMADMVAVMSAQTQEVLVQVERVAGDLAAAANAAEAAVHGYEPSFRARPSDRNRARLWQAAETWLRVLDDQGATEAHAAAVAHLAETFTGHDAELQRLAAPRPADAAAK